MGVAIVIVVAYVAGSIPFSFIAGKLFAGIDLREHGSGNLGASNTFRFLGAKIASLVLLGDLAKGFLPVYFAPALAWGSELPDYSLMLMAAFSAVIGHMFSVFVRFRGGKGVATTGGAFLAFAPAALLAAFVIWVVVFATIRIVSVASMVAALALPFVVYFVDQLGFASYHRSVLLLSVAITVVVLVKHRSNIKRLIAGQEPVLHRHKR